MSRYQRARESRLAEIEKEYRLRKKYEKKQDTFNRYVKEICPNCLNKNGQECNICVAVDGTVKCCNYKKDESKFKTRHK